jgi:hypothetical protein
MKHGGGEVKYTGHENAARDTSWQCFICLMAHTCRIKTPNKSQDRTLKLSGIQVVSLYFVTVKWLTELVPSYHLISSISLHCTSLCIASRHEDARLTSSLASWCSYTVLGLNFELPAFNLYRLTNHSKDLRGYPQPLQASDVNITNHFFRNLNRKLSLPYSSFVWQLRYLIFAVVKCR